MVKITREIDLYKELLEKYKEIIILNNITQIIAWDMETQMPSKGIEQRSDELAMLSGIIHDRIVDPEIGSLLKDIQEHKNYEKLSEIEKRNIYLIQRDYDLETKLPKDLVTELAKQTAIAKEVWKKAKKESNFELFKPQLEKIVELVKKQANYLNPNIAPYDVLLDIYEHGFNKEIIDKLFSELRDGLVPLIKACIASPNQPNYSLLERKCSKEIQKKMNEDIARMIGYNLDAGRIDESAHPFTTGYFDDVRLTTIFDENNFSSNFFSVLHEGGHAIYEQNLPLKHKWEPCGSSCSMGVHESQSRFIENIIGRSIELWKYYFPRLNELTGDIFKDLEFDEFIRAINRVTPSKIRVDADPVTYSLHVIIRYEIEKDIFAGKIAVADLPKIWNQKMRDYLGVEIENDTEGVLQDDHWADGAFGYFPDYALGNIYDGQLLMKMEQDLPNWRDQIAKGDLSRIIKWLISNVHQRGNLYDPLILIEKITGEQLTTKYYLEYLKKEYSKFYEL